MEAAMIENVITLQELYSKNDILPYLPSILLNFFQGIMLIFTKSR